MEFNPFNFLNRDPKPKPKADKILPEDVRYALRYREGRVRKQEIELLNMSHFENEASYLVLKTLRSNPELQREYIADMVQVACDAQFEKMKSIEKLRDVTQNRIPDLPDTEVEAGKLAQISRQGFAFWQEKFKELGEELATDDREVFFVAHSVLLGLTEFSRAFHKTKKPFSILVPDWMVNGSETIGHHVSFNTEGEPSVTLLHMDFDRPERAVLVDDTVNTGGTMKRVIEFWKKKIGTEPETKTIVQKTS